LVLAIADRLAHLRPLTNRTEVRRRTERACACRCADRHRVTRGDVCWRKSAGRCSLCFYPVTVPRTDQHRILGKGCAGGGRTISGRGMPTTGRRRDGLPTTHRICTPQSYMGCSGFDKSYPSASTRALMVRVRVVEEDDFSGTIWGRLSHCL